MKNYYIELFIISYTILNILNFLLYKFVNDIWLIYNKINYRSNVLYLRNLK